MWHWITFVKWQVFAIFSAFKKPPVSNGVHHQCEEFPCRPSCVDSVLSLPDVVREFHEKATGGVKRGPLKSPQSPIPDIGTVDVEPAAAFCVNSFREIWQNVISSQSKNLLCKKKNNMSEAGDINAAPSLNS